VGIIRPRLGMDKKEPKRSDSRAVQVLAYNLQILRQKHRLSQESLALRSGIHRTAFRELEACATVPSLVTVEKLARALGVSVSDLLRDTGKELTKQPVFRMPRGVSKKDPKTGGRSRS